MDDNVITKKLKVLKDSGEQAAIYMANGIRLEGRVLDFDSEGIILSSDTIPDGVGIMRVNVSTVGKKGDRSRK